jgi:hypothetical protein
LTCLFGGGLIHKFPKLCPCAFVYPQAFLKVKMMAVKFGSYPHLVQGRLFIDDDFCTVFKRQAQNTAGGLVVYVYLALVQQFFQAD